jgi:uncharacterized protein YbjT (DUF2867 family)
MKTDPILLIGGAGYVGNHAARTLRRAHPDLPLLIGGRDPSKAAPLVAELGNAEAVAIDLSKDDLGLGNRPVSGVGIFLKDNHTTAIRFAQNRGVPFASVSTVMIEMATEVAAYIHNPRSTIVLSSEWLAGAGMLTTLHAAKAYRQLETIKLVGILDPADMGGAAAAADSTRLGPVMSGAMIRENGAYRWLSGNDIPQRVTCVDGTAIDGFAYGVFDVQALTEATGARNVKFVFAVANSAGSRAGGPPSSEIVVELAGTDHQGNPKRSRHAMVSMAGQAAVTGFGIALVLERATGLDGQPAPAHGLYFVEGLLTPEAYRNRATAAGFSFLDL